MEVSLQLTKRRFRDQIRADISEEVNEHLLDLIIGTHADDSQRESFRQLLLEGALDDRNVEVEIPQKPSDKSSGNGNSADLHPTVEILKLMTKGGGRSKGERRTMPVRDARPIVEEIEIEKKLEGYDITRQAIASVEQSGIVFIDEIDKVISAGEYRSADASSEGVQRDLLPLVEGCSISTKYGNVNTDHILFIASGAFHSHKPSDLLAELQGRLPIRVTLKGLTEEDLYRILTEPVSNLLRQQVELMKTENVDLVFTDAAIREIARVAFLVRCHPSTLIVV